MPAAPVETLIHRFFANADRLGSRPSCHYPANGAWVPLGWRTAAGLVRDFASGLIALGHRKGDALAIVATTRREWMTCDLGNQAAGGITVGVYPTMTPDQTRYIIAHCEARFVVVEDARQLAKVDSVRAGMPRVETVIVIDPTGVAPRPGVLTLAEVQARGHAERHDVQARLDELRLEDAATFIYTSGTTGPPKGAMVTHGNIVAALRAVTVVPVDPETDSGFSFLPLAHSLQRTVNYRAAWEGTGGVYARSLDTVAEDLALARPTLVAAVPRIFEKIYARILEQAAQSPPRKKRIFDWALEVGRMVATLRQEKKPVPGALAVQHALAKALVYDKLREKLGGKIRLFITGGAPIAAEILQFFAAADILILEGWGMTETFAVGTINSPEDYRFGSIGKPVGGVEMKLDDDGEILVRGPNVFAGYYKDDDATKASFTPEGFFRTGDIGRIDGDGFFYIIDRKKDLIITAAGKNIAPQNIENLLKADPRISQVMAIGDRRPYVVALISVAPELRAARSDAELGRMVNDIVAKKNEELASYEKIKKFRILPVDLTAEAGDLTPTLKLRRKVVAEKYASLIEEMYAETKPAVRSGTA